MSEAVGSVVQLTEPEPVYGCIGNCRACDKRGCLFKSVLLFDGPQDTQEDK